MLIFVLYLFALPLLVVRTLRAILSSPLAGRYNEEPELTAKVSTRNEKRADKANKREQFSTKQSLAQGRKGEAEKMETGSTLLEK